MKKKYKAYLYVDEAHSIGAIGPHGKGVCDYAGVSPADVDILMGTYTKSFASVGGYIAGSKELIAYLRNTAFSALGDTSHSVPCCQQIISAFDVIEGVDGTGDGQVRACSSSLLQLYDLLQREDLAFHGVDALHHDENLGPRPMRPRLPFCDRLAQHALQV